MKKLILFLLIISSFLSCTKDNPELKEQFIGTWNDFPYTGFQNEIQFYQDSIILWSHCRKSKGTWDVDSTYIRIHIPEGAINPDMFEYENFKYRMNDRKDSLFINANEESNEEHLLIKVENHWSHYLKSYNLDIDLPQIVSKENSLIKKKPIVYLRFI